MAEKSNQDIIVNELLRLIPISYIMSDGFATACTNSRYQFIWNYTHLYLLSVNIMDVRTEEQKAEENFRKFCDCIFPQGEKVFYDLVVFVVSNYCKNEQKKIDVKGLRFALREIGVSDFTELNRYDADLPISNIVEKEILEWSEIKDDIIKLEMDSCRAEETIDFQNVGNSCRTLLVKVATLVYVPDIHGKLSSKGDKIGPSDAIGMLDNYFSYKLSGGKNEVLRSYAKHTKDLVNELTHRPTAQKQDMQIALSATIHLIYLIGIIEGKI